MQRVWQKWKKAHLVPNLGVPFLKSLSDFLSLPDYDDDDGWGFQWGMYLVSTTAPLDRETNLTING